MNFLAEDINFECKNNLSNLDNVLTCTSISFDEYFIINATKIAACFHLMLGIPLLTAVDIRAKILVFYENLQMSQQK